MARKLAFGDAWTGDGVTAATRAGYGGSNRSKAQIASRLLRDPEVRARIEARGLGDLLPSLTGGGKRRPLKHGLGPQPKAKSGAPLSRRDLLEELVGDETIHPGQRMAAARELDELLAIEAAAARATEQAQPDRALVWVGNARGVEPAEHVLDSLTRLAPDERAWVLQEAAKLEPAKTGTPWAGSGADDEQLAASIARLEHLANQLTDTEALLWFLEAVVADSFAHPRVRSTAAVIAQRA